jgi:hypothetical protein
VFSPFLLGLRVLHAIGRVVLSIPHAPSHALSRVLNYAMPRCTGKLCTLCEPLPVQGRTAWSHQPAAACSQSEELKNLLGAGSGKAVAFPVPFAVVTGHDMQCYQLQVGEKHSSHARALRLLTGLLTRQCPACRFLRRQGVAGDLLEQQAG